MCVCEREGIGIGTTAGTHTFPVSHTKVVYYNSHGLSITSKLKEYEKGTTQGKWEFVYEEKEMVLQVAAFVLTALSRFFFFFFFLSKVMVTPV